jgi:DNA-binding NtrC family response regulator
VDVLVIAATNRPLDEMVDKGAFRQDLLARFDRPVLFLPPLRDRREDVFAIAQAWLSESGTPLDARETEVEAVEHLLREGWRANVRELGGRLAEIAAEDRPGVLHAWAVKKVLGVSPPPKGLLTADRVEQAVARHGSEAAAARALDVPRGTLRRRRGK